MLGDRIAYLRREKGYTQAQLAQLLHISASALGMYEQGRRIPGAEVLVELSRQLQVSVDYLLTGKTIFHLQKRKAHGHNAAATAAAKGIAANNRSTISDIPVPQLTIIRQNRRFL